eukprot:symbB.v1.2.006027.t1/scaffold328.1/size228725/2
MSCDLEMVLKELKRLNSVKQRFEAAVQECSWRCGTGSRAMRDFRWQCFTDAVVAELHDSRDVDTENFRFEACVPTHFLLGRQLHTPMFPVTSDGLSGGWSAYGALYGAAVGLGSSRGKRRNRFSSVRCGMSAEEETWQRLRSVYASVWMAAGQSSKRLEAQLTTLERHFGSRRSSDMFPTPSMSKNRSSQDAEQKIEKLLQRWNKRKPSGSKPVAGLGVQKNEAAFRPPQDPLQLLSSLTESKAASSGGYAPSKSGLRICEAEELRSFRRVPLPGGVAFTSFVELEAAVAQKFASKRRADGSEACISLSRRYVVGRFWFWMAKWVFHPPEPVYTT